MQARYGAIVRSLVNDLFRQRNLIKDGTSGRSLVENPVALLSVAIQRVVDKGHKPNFANNSALIHAAVFGFVKEQTQRGWSEHTSEAEYQEAVKIARCFFCVCRSSCNGDLSARINKSGIAGRLARTGSGEVIPVSRLSVPRLQAAIERVLSEDSCKRRYLGRKKQFFELVG